MGAEQEAAIETGGEWVDQDGGPFEETRIEAVEGKEAY